MGVTGDRGEVMGIDADALLMRGPQASGRVLLLDDGACGVAIVRSNAVALMGLDWCACVAALRLRAAYWCPLWSGS
jgi:hypothetical protein